MAHEQAEQLDEKFYDRADAHIALANGHINQQIHPGWVSNSFMFAASRFNAWLAAAGAKDAEEMQEKKGEIMDYFLSQYKAMLEENVDDYIANFNTYMGKSDA